MADDLVKRLRAVGGVRHDGATRWYVNPDGIEAADRIEELEKKLADVHNELNTADHDGYAKASQQYARKIEKLEHRIETLERTLRDILKVPNSEAAYGAIRMFVYAALAGEKKDD